MANKTAINIKTEKWHQVIDCLRDEDWKCTLKYHGMDAGIDSDFLVLRKGFRRIVFAWSNWEEGEIKCNNKLFQYLENKFDVKLQYGKPINLSSDIIWTFYMQSLPPYFLRRDKWFDKWNK